MNKRKFLKVAALTGLASVTKPFNLLEANPGTSASISDTLAGKFTLPPLPYGYDALEPHIDKMTMQIHHDKHHQGYTDKLNAAIAGTQYEDMTIEEILEKVGKDESTMRNNGGGFYNHSLFWKWMTPNDGAQPEGKLADAINSAFESLEGFKEKFTTTATGVFGSGWAWLLADKNGSLSIASTPNQDSPLMSFAEAKGVPILGIDVWEHAYYLKYQNKRPEYVAAFMEIINWEEVAKLYQANS